MMYIWIIGLCVIVLGTILYAGKNRNNVFKKESPSEILDRRFANGEITEEEYQERKRIMNSKN